MDNHDHHGKDSHKPQNKNKNKKQNSSNNSVLHSCSGSNSLGKGCRQPTLPNGNHLPTDLTTRRSNRLIQKRMRSQHQATSVEHEKFSVQTSFPTDEDRRCADAKRPEHKRFKSSEQVKDFDHPDDLEKKQRRRKLPHKVHAEEHHDGSGGTNETIPLIDLELDGDSRGQPTHDPEAAVSKCLGRADDSLEVEVVSENPREDNNSANRCKKNDTSAASAAASDRNDRTEHGAEATEKCGICSEDVENPSVLENCFHKFCFKCIVERSEVDPKCPECDGKFSRFYYEVRNDLDFKTFAVRPEEDSPPEEETVTTAVENCSICLEELEETACPQECLHKFCFGCIRKWSEKSSRCPLCMTHFSAIYHNIKNDDLYDVHLVNAPIITRPEQPTLHIPSGAPAQPLPRLIFERRVICGRRPDPFRPHLIVFQPESLSEAESAHGGVVRSLRPGQNFLVSPLESQWQNLAAQHRPLRQDAFREQNSRLHRIAAERRQRNRNDSPSVMEDSDSDSDS